MIWPRDALRGCNVTATNLPENDLFAIRTGGRNPVIHAILSLMTGLLCAALVLGLAGCGGSDSGENNAGDPAAGEIPGDPAPGEIPGVPNEGDPGSEEDPGADSSPEPEIPGVTGVPGPPPPCANDVGPFGSALCGALHTELDAIEANSPPDASERLDFLASLSSSPVDAATQLADYDWLSTTAEGVFGEATLLLETE